MHGTNVKRNSENVKLETIW